MVIACNKILGAIRNKLYYSVRADLCTSSTAYTLFLIHLNVPIFIIAYGLYRPYRNPYGGILLYKHSGPGTKGKLRYSP